MTAATSQPGGMLYFCVSKGLGDDNLRAVFQSLIAEGHHSEALFTYVCSLYSPMPDCSAYPRTLQTLPWKFLSAWDNKQSLALKLQQSGCENAFAPTYASTVAAWYATQSDPSALFFVKLAESTKGWGMKVLRRNELLSCQVSSVHVIQQAVQHLTLVNGRKFVIRFYLLVHNKKLFLHKRGAVIVHGAAYDCNSTDNKVQIAHDFDQPGSTARVLALNAFVQGEQWRQAIEERVIEIMPALQPLVDATSNDCYAFIGGDALIQDTGDAKLIELNPFPAMWAQSVEFNTQVSKPILHDLVTKVMFGSNDTDFIELQSRGSQFRRQPLQQYGLQPSQPIEPFACGRVAGVAMPCFQQLVRVAAN